MPTATLTTATLETIGRPKTSKFEGKPDYRPCLFKRADGSEFWKSYVIDAPELDWLKKGVVYQVAIAGDEITIIQPTGENPPPAPSQGAPGPQPGPALTDDQKRAIARYIADLAPLYAYCYQQAATQLEPHGAPDGAIQAGASSLFIAAQKRFNLA